MTPTCDHYVAYWDGDYDAIMFTASQLESKYHKNFIPDYKKKEVIFYYYCPICGATLNREYYRKL